MTLRIFLEQRLFAVQINYITIIMSIANKLYRLEDKIINRNLLSCHLNKRSDLYLHKTSIKQGLSIQTKLDCRTKSICWNLFSVL